MPKKLKSRILIHVDILRDLWIMLKIFGIFKISLKAEFEDFSRFFWMFLDVFMIVEISNETFKI